MPNNDNYRLKFYKEELFNAKKNLFSSGSVRLLKATEERIKYLDSMVVKLTG